MVVELRACLEIFYGFVARLLQPTFTTKWAGLGWACHSLAAEYIGPGLLLLLRDLQCCRPPELGLAWLSQVQGRGGGTGHGVLTLSTRLGFAVLQNPRFPSHCSAATSPSPGPRLVSTLELVGGWQCRQLAGRVRLHDCRDYLYTSPVSEYWPLVLQKVASEGS